MTSRHHANVPEMVLRGLARLPAAAALALIRAYQLTFSGLVGRQCRHLPTCSHYADEAISRHGFWAGTWMGTARICRCQPFGTAGFDPVPEQLDSRARWYLPWRYGHWRGVEPARSSDPENLELR